MNFDELKQQCLACQRCGLCETRTHVVFGQGVPDAEVLFVGEGPGANEDAVWEVLADLDDALIRLLRFATAVVTSRLDDPTRC